MAALLRCPDGSAVTGPLVLGLLGIDAFSDMDPFEILVPVGSRVRNVAFPHRPNPSLTPTRRIGPLVVAAPVRGLVDAGRPGFQIPDNRLWKGYDSARWINAVSLPRFLRELAASPPRDAGARRWRSMADERMLKLESPKERDLDRILQCLDPLPEPQVNVTPGRRVDFFWRRFRIALEYLGEAGHAHARGRRADVLRDAELEAVGILTVGVTKQDLRHLMR